MITIFTDGSSRGNPGPGGWGAIVVANGNVTELGGRENLTTNNRMELTAAIRGLSEVLRNVEGISGGSDVSGDSVSNSEKITVNTDSAYVINGITKWVSGWKKKNWKTIEKKDVLNRDLWEELDAVVVSATSAFATGEKISWNYVGGHAGIAGNERCDVIATSFADGKPVELFSGLMIKYPIANVLDISVSSVSVSAYASSPTLDRTSVSSKSRSKASAFSYVSKVDGVIEIDKTWKECEKRVKGMRGARYKKALNKAEESEIIADFRKNS